MKATGTERLPYYAKVGQDVIGFGSVAEVIEKTKLNWAVEKQPIFLDGGKRIEDRFATVRTDTGATLGMWARITKSFRTSKDSALLMIV